MRDEVLTVDETVAGTRSEKEEGTTYSERADLEPQSDNLLILGESGDVLEALTRMPEWSEKYVGKVKCIYIDPPFNTAQTFANYEDNLEHSVWLTMMRDRLLHMRDLLSEDGSIWVHLDDVENHRMRVLLDEVFGAENFVAEVQWQKSDTLRNDSRGFSTDFDEVIVYRKSDKWALNRVERPESLNAIYKSPDDDPERWFNAGPTAPGAKTHQGMVYAIQNPITGDLHYPLKGRHWAWSQDEILKCLSEYADYELKDIGDAGRRSELCGITEDSVRSGVEAIVVKNDLSVARSTATARVERGHWPVFHFSGKHGEGYPAKKTYIPSEGISPRTFWSHEDVGSNRTAKLEIQQFAGSTSAFATPKPERLLERIIHIATKPGDIVLDCFGGSGTTAAVAQKMGRRWVTCELVEDTFNRFTRPRLEKVVNNEDQGGISLQKEERADATEDGLPEGLTPEEAQKFTSLLNKTIKNSDELKKNPAVKQLKAMTKTKPVKGVVNWRGGGGFSVAHLEPACFDYDPEVALTTLTEHATGGLLVRSVAAQLRFALTPNDLHFDGKRGREHLVVVEGVLDEEKIDEVMSHLPDGHSVLFAATVVDDLAREHVRGFKNGSRVVHVPLEVFPYSDAAEEEK